jgi:hypothetical protein
VYGGSGHGGLDTDLANAQTAAVNATGKPSWTKPTVTVDDEHAQAIGTNCFDPGTWKTVSMSSPQPMKPPAGTANDKQRPAYPGEPAGKYQTVTTFDKDGTGRWVVFAIVAHRSSPAGSSRLGPTYRKQFHSGQRTYRRSTIGRARYPSVTRRFTRRRAGPHTAVPTPGAASAYPRPGGRRAHAAFRHAHRQLPPRPSLPPCSGPQADAASSVHYVALGDSYASGLGAGSLIGSSGSCDLRTKAASALWALAHAPASYTSVACSGATTTSLNSSQLSALSASTTLVSVTIGGNDVGFSNILETCALDRHLRLRRRRAGGRELRPDHVAGGSIRRTTGSGLMSERPRGRADYPVFYQLGTVCVGLSATSHSKLDEGINILTV